MRDKAAILAAILHPRRRRMPLHFFFTPNRVTSSVVATMRRVQRKRVVLQSVMSADGIEARARLLRPVDAVVALSDHTMQRLVEAGLDPRRVRRIYPGVPLPEPPPTPRAEPGEGPPTILYAGDLDAACVDRLVAVGLAAHEHQRWRLVVAARPKAEDDAVHRARLLEALEGPIAGGAVEVHGHVPDIGACMRGAALQLYAAEHVRNKVDLPLVILEGLAVGLPLVSLRFEPLQEIHARARERALEVGLSVEPDVNALVRALLPLFSGPSEQLLKWRDGARRLAEAEFSAKGMASEYAQLYRRMHTGE
jgi:glycosyltransferase involved in cell wall biosynthesis